MKFIKNNKSSKIILLIVAIIGICLIVLGIISSISPNKNKDETKVEFNFKTEYEAYNGKEDILGRKYIDIKIPSKNKIKKADIDEILEIFTEKKDAVIYFGYSACTYCRTAAEILVETANNTKIDKILYLDTSDKSENYNKLLEIFIDEFKENNKIYSPLVLFVRDGNVISYHKGTLFSQDDPYIKLDSSQREGLSEIYKNGIEDVLNKQ